MRERLFVALMTVVWTTVTFSISRAAPRNVLPGRYNLYGPDDSVFQLNGTTIMDKVFNSDKAWFVEFYAHWCGHCIRFAPVYKLFAADVYDWRNVAVVAALNCADESNTDVCAEFNIHTYPTLRFFPPNYPQNSTENNGTSISQGIEVKKGDGSVSNLKQKLIDLLEPQFANLLSFTNHSGNGTGGLAELWSSNETDIPRPSAIVMIFENTTSYLGKQIALRLSLHRNIKVFRFSKPNELYDTYSARSNKTSSLAVLFVGQDGIPKPVIISDRKPVDSVYQAVLQLAGIQIALQSSLEPAARPVTGFPARNETVNKMNHTDVVSMEDLLRTLRDSLYTEVLLSRNVSGRRLEALKSYLNTVTKYFPGDKPEIKNFFHALSNWISPKQTLQSSELKERLKALEENYNPWVDIDFRSWEDCKASIPGRRGYTCGLWRLFHTLTLVAVKVNGTEGPMDAIHGYVENFFGCQECSEHFRAMVKRDDILTQKSTTAQALWLWKAHNEVNLRTKGTLSEDPAYPKGNYPSRQLCPKCLDANENYVAPSVLKYLLDVYTNPVRRNKKTDETKADSTPTGSRRLRDIAYSIISFFI